MLAVGKDITEVELDADVITDTVTDRPTAVGIVGIGMEARADPLVVEDPSDNAGDADAAGDGSACMEDMFIGYDNSPDHEIHPGETSEKGFQTQLHVSIKSKLAKPTVLGMPMEDLVFVCLLSQASI